MPKNRVPTAIYLAFFQKKLNSTSIHIKFSFKKINIRNILASFTAYFFLSSGFFFAFLLSNIFFEYRLTLSQITPLFHGIGAVLIAFYIDPMLSKSLDDEIDNTLWLTNIYSVMLGRIFSYLFISCLFMLIIFFL